MSGIRLVEVSRDDGPDLIDANVTNREFHQPWSDPFTDEEGFNTWFEKLGDTNASLLVRHMEDKGIVGVFNFTEIVRGVFQSAYLGYYGMEAYCSRGLMTAGLMAAIHHAFTVLDLHRVEANFRPENTRSIALVQRVGFRKEGFSPNYLFLDGAWRDHERWVITQEELGAS